jgi:hypothetical protein
VTEISAAAIPTGCEPIDLSQGITNLCAVHKKWSVVQ